MSETYVFSLLSQTGQNFFSARSHAAILRKNIEPQIKTSESFAIDFSETGMTQSFADELVGVLAFLHGPELFKKLKFKGCSDESKTILNFVVQQRLKDRDLKAKQFNSHYGDYRNSGQSPNKSECISNRLEAVAC